MDEIKEKTGIGIITCNRPEFLVRLLNGISHCNFNNIVIVNDGDYIDALESYNYKVITNETNLGVGKSKNKAMQHLLNENCDYIFIIEDDMIIHDVSVFSKYINACKITGIQHFNFGPGTPFNRKQTVLNFDLHNRHLLSNNSKPNPKLTIEYNSEVSIDLYEHIVGSFSFFTRQILEKVGLHDEDFINAWEHVDHTYRIIKEEAHPPFWWFADIKDSIKYIEVSDDAIEKSTISTNQEKWIATINKGREIYFEKHGVYPNTTPLTTRENVINNLKHIKLKWKI